MLDKCKKYISRHEGGWKITSKLQRAKLLGWRSGTIAYLEEGFWHIQFCTFKQLSLVNKDFFNFLNNRCQRRDFEMPRLPLIGNTHDVCNCTHSTNPYIKHWHLLRCSILYGWRRKISFSRWYLSTINKS